MKLSEALKVTGFTKCEFGPERGMICESCDSDNRQLYFRSGCYEHPSDGVYYCAKCVKSEAEENKRLSGACCAKCGAPHTVRPEDANRPCFDCYANNEPKPLTKEQLDFQRFCD